MSQFLKRIPIDQLRKRYRFAERTSSQLSNLPRKVAGEFFFVSPSSFSYVHIISFSTHHHFVERDPFYYSPILKKMTLNHVKKKDLL
jgi:hypothetical protein